MERQIIAPRADWQKKVEAAGMDYHTLPAARYWDESLCYRFSAAQIDQIETATNELHRICVEAALHVIEADLFSRFHIPEEYVPLICESWDRKDASIYGRFDLWYDGTHEPKLYEYNADTPTMLLESSVVQWYWLEEVFPKADQFNSIHERLIARWKECGINGMIHFACVATAEDVANTKYMRDVAAQAGFRTGFLTMADIGWNGREFVDLENRQIDHLFKLYPWEWLIAEAFSLHLIGEPWQVIEPAWKMLLSNKSILPLLWELFPGHPNLLPAFATPEPLGENYIRKPILGREGANTTLKMGRHEWNNEGSYGEEGYIYQAASPPPNVNGFYPVIGSWIVGDEAAGIGIRESSQPITSNQSRFVPHYFVN